MGPNTLSGVIFLAIGGLCAATNFIPFRQIKRWSWEVYWPIQAFTAWVAVPVLAACLLVPNCCGILQEAWQADPRGIWLALLFGMVWGVGGMAFGLAIRYLGIALGYVLTLGFCIVCGLLGPIVLHGRNALPASGHAVLLSVAVCAIGIALSAVSGRRKELEMTLEVKLEAGEQDYHFSKGLAMAALAGLMSLFLGFGLNAAAPVTTLTQTELLTRGRPEIWAYLPVLAVILAGKFATNLVWSAVLILQNRSAKQFLGEPGVNPMRAVATSGDTLVDFDPLDPSTYDRLAPGTLIANYFFAALAGVFWYLQLVFYFVGANKLIGQTLSPKLLQVAFALLFAALWGLAVKEWRGTTPRTRLLVGFGLILVVASTLIVR